MILLNALINQLRMKDALLFRSANLTEAQAVSIGLVKAGFGRIPRGYLKFLNLSDGLVWQDLELFGCASHERAGTVFDQQNLLTYQSKYAQGRFFARRLVLGRLTEALICYNSENQCYELVNRDSLMIMLKFPRFEDILYQVIA